MLTEQLLADLAERIRNRFYGKYRGVVTQVDGPTMRVKAKVVSVLGDQETGWATPCVPYAGPQVGIAFLPEVGSGVWIEFEGGDVSYPIWVGCYWRSGEFPSEAKEDVKTIISRKLKFTLDDANSKATWSDPNNNIVTLDSNGLALESGSKNVKIGTSNVSVNDGALEVT
jgi:uncharacterized protein involved in type VI secretion and phage assembly